MFVFHEQGKVIVAEHTWWQSLFVTGNDEKGDKAEGWPLFISIALWHATVQTSKLAGFQHRQLKKV